MNSSKDLQQLQKVAQLFEAGQFDAVVKQVDKAKWGSPEAKSQAYYLAGLGRLQQQQFAVARQYFERALASARSQEEKAKVHHELAVSFSSEGLWDEAKSHFAQSLKMNDKEATLKHLGIAQYQSGDYQSAIVSFKRLAEQTNDFVAYGNLADSLGNAGEIDSAVEYFSKAILHPDNQYAEFAYGWASLEKVKSWGAETQKMVDVIDGANPPIDARISLHFALGKIHEDLKNYEASAQQYKQGNRLRRSQFHYDESQLEIFADGIRSAYEALCSQLVPVSTEIAPIFIVGMPRAGSTLIERHLSMHSEVTACGEMTLLHAMIQGTSKIVSNEQVHLFGGEKLNAAQWQAIGERYLDSVKPQLDGNNVFTDKLPQNFYYLGILARLFPKARFIDIRRERNNTCFSCFANLFTAGQFFTYKLQELNSYYDFYQSLMDYWLNEEALGARIVPISYESFVSDHEASARELIDAVGLQWEPAVLEFHQSKSAVATASRGQVQQKIYSHAKTRWDNYADYFDGTE